jgi:hypothetical protein
MWPAFHQQNAPPLAVVMPCRYCRVKSCARIGKEIHHPFISIRGLQDETLD